MNRKELYQSFHEVDDDILERSETVTRNNKKPARMKWGALAACLCMVVIGAVCMLAYGHNGTPVLTWSESFRAENYFRYNLGINDASSTKSIVDSDILYAEARSFSDDRSQMEADGVIPEMPNHPLYSCNVRYNEDGSILSVTFSWHQRGEVYSDLSITAGYQEVKLIQDCIVVQMDDNGNIVPPSVTVTERDGIQIVAVGNENSEKTITFQNDTAWYQIAGSWGDSCEAVAELLDWVWEHPIDFDRFTMEKGVEFTSTNLEACPDAFSGYIPDFEVLGYVQGENFLVLKDGIPYRFEGHYYTGVEEAKVEDGSYLLEEGWTEIHWCIDTEPDYYDLQDCLGDITQLSKQQIAEVLSENSNFSFMLEDCFIRVYCKDAAEAWSAIESLN